MMVSKVIQTEESRRRERGCTETRCEAVSFGMLALPPLEMYLVQGLLVHTEDVFLSFKGISVFYSTISILMSIPTSSGQGFSFLLNLSSVFLCPLMLMGVLSAYGSLREHLIFGNWSCRG